MDFDHKPNKDARQERNTRLRSSGLCDGRVWELNMRKNETYLTHIKPAGGCRRHLRGQMCKPVHCRAESQLSQGRGFRWHRTYRAKNKDRGKLTCPLLCSQRHIPCSRPRPLLPLYQRSSRRMARTSSYLTSTCSWHAIMYQVVLLASSACSWINHHADTSFAIALSPDLE